MGSHANNIIDTDFKTIRTFRDVHATIERNAFIEEAERQAAIKEEGGRQNLAIESNTQTAKKEEKKKDERVAKEQDAKDAYVESNIPPPSPEVKDTFDAEAWKKKVEEDIEESFKIFDINGDGKISLHEVMSIMQSVGRDVSPDEAQDIVELIDEDGDGQINFQEFHNLMYEKMSQQTVDEDLQGCFDMFDLDKDGFITPVDVQRLFSKIGQLMTVDEAAEIMAACDMNDDGLIDFADFKEFYEKITAPPKPEVDDSLLENATAEGEQAEKIPSPTSFY